MIRLSSFLFVLLFSMNAGAQFYHGMHHPFGKNRVQYEEFDWQKYEFDHYTVFFYGNGKNLAVYTAKNAEEMVEEVEQFFDYSLKRNRIQFVVYQKMEHFRQSNVGIPETDESNIGGSTQIAGSKIFTYYDGDLSTFRTQIRKGVAQVLVGQMLFGDNWREMIKNNTLMNFPEWFTKGLINYAAEPWNVNADDRLKDLVERGKYKKFNRLQGFESEIAGHSLWYYIGETYGTNVIPNIMYMARVTRNIESGFLFVLGISLNTLLNDAKEYFAHRYEFDTEGSQEFVPFMDIKTKKARDYSALKQSDNGRFVSYVSNDLSKTKVFVYDQEKERRKKYMRHGHRLERMYDLSYPIMDWNPVTGELFIVNERRGKIWLYRYDATKKKRISKIELLRLEKVLDMEFSPDGKQIAFSAINKAQSDIYLYSIAANSSLQLTNDIYDDRDPAFWTNDELLFVSNRSMDSVDIADDHLEFEPKPFTDLYSLNLASPKVVFNLSNTEFANEANPRRLNRTEYVFSSDQSGIRNRYKGLKDSSIVSIDTAITYRYYTRNEPISGYPRNVMDFDYVTNSDEPSLVEMFFYDGKYRFQNMKGADILQPHFPANSSYRQGEALQIRNRRLEETPEEEPDSTAGGLIIIKKKVFEDLENGSIADDGTIDIDNYQFDADAIADVENGETFRAEEVEEVDTTAVEAEEPFVLPEQRNYYLAFAATDLTTQFDFDYATELYQPFNGGPYVMPGMGTFLKVGMLDVFEDYKLEGGFRYSFNQSGTEFFISLEDRSKRLDKKYIVQRQSLRTGEGLDQYNNRLYQLRAILRYALDEVNALQITPTVRYDRRITLGSTEQRVDDPDITNYWVGLKAEYIFDNTLNPSLNILNGSRLKIFGEHYREVIDPNTDISIVGLDARNYIKIHRDLIWANRLAASSSFGTRKLVYYMGSVDNWITLSNREKFDQTTNIANDQGYQFQTIATNMRGFIQNARNGNNFAVVNSEVRWPVVRYFTNKPIKSKFLSTLQVIGFGDVGTAWNRPDPYSDENTFNKIEADNGPNSSIKVIYKNQNDPIIGGVGWGLRAKIWGYFIRYDYAWGIENGVFLDPVSYLSFGLDF
ncbi:MAG: hypothetical protein HOM40_03715 [Flavobacteriales bacterium]|nr:hypothetical protein [Flavobacteriales bacterium]